MDKGKKLQKTISIILLILCLVATNLIYAATSTVYALSESENQDLEFKVALRDNNYNDVENEDELSIKMVVKTGETEVKDGDNVYEGQVIRYTYTITNNSDNDIENIKLVANHEGANVFEEDVRQQENTIDTNEILDFVAEIENVGKSDKEENIETLKPNEKITISYQVRVKENVETIKSEVILSADDIKDKKEYNENPVIDGKLKIEVTNGYKEREYSMSKGMTMPITLNVVNISDKDEENITLTCNIPNGFKVTEVSGTTNDDNFETENQTNEAVAIKINKIEKNSSEKIKVFIQMEEENPETDTVYVSSYAELDNVKYISNDINFKVSEHKKSMFSAKQTANITDEQVKTGDELIYKITIENTGDTEDNVMLTDVLPTGTVIQRVYYIKDSEEIEVDNFKNNIVVKSIDINQNEIIEFFIETEVDESLTGNPKIENYATIEGMNSAEKITTNKITHKLQANIKEGNEENPREDDPGEDKTGKTKLSISGLAWIDENQNGIRETTENKLPGINVVLADVETGKYITDSEGNTLEITTDENGEYKFENIEKGKYMVIFAYDIEKYRTTEHKEEEKTNSDIITNKTSKTNEYIEYGLTDILELKDSNLENIDAGFIENEKSDSNTNTYITIVIITAILAITITGIVIYKKKKKGDKI